MAIRCNPFTVSATLRMESSTRNSSPSNRSVSSVMMPKMRMNGNGRRNGHGRKIWRRRKLVKKDEYLDAKMERLPFLEEQVRIVKERGGLFAGDIARLLLSEENRYDFVNEVAAEANEYVERNRDEYGGLKKAILHVLSDRMNEAGFCRPDAYAEPDPFKPPGFWREDDY